MAEEIVQIEGLAELEEALRRALSPQVIGRALLALGEEVKLRAVPYPPEGPWNQPGPYPARWYQRHFGPRWALKRGGIGGRNISEQMQQRWFVRQEGPAQVRVGNTASYAAYVMGEAQQPYHAAHGWEKLREIAETVVREEARDVFAREIRNALGG